MLHWQSFLKLQSEIFKYKCDTCKDEQMGVQWIETNSSLNSGYSIRYQLQCTKCHEALGTFDTSPRVVVEQKDDQQLTVTPTNKLESNSTNLLGILLNIITLQHGAQNTFFETMSSFLILPIWSPTAIKNHKLAAAKIINSTSVKSIERAQQRLHEFIKAHLKISGCARLNETFKQSKQVLSTVACIRLFKRSTSAKHSVAQTRKTLAQRN